ncbi:hypothetical protein C8Q75DRAFT_452684 [Abortiporus biennis]|nr:hypothetical protein C8Q75DRAFT_452684 [Abortiporus biennis]
MAGYRELSRLPRVSGPGSLRSIAIRRMTPGSASGFVGQPFTVTNPLDPTHPFAKQRKRELSKLPSHSIRGVGFRIVPKALLTKPKPQWPNPPYGYETPKRGQLGMSMMRIVSKKTIHKSAVIRKAIMKKIKTALYLIAIRGANVVKDGKGSKTIVFRKEDIGDRWILQDWTYLVFPTLLLYRMPYTDLIPPLRNCLLDLATRARTFERVWQHPYKKQQPVARVRQNLTPARQPKREETTKPIMRLSPEFLTRIVTPSTTSPQMSKRESTDFDDMDSLEDGHLFGDESFSDRRKAFSGSTLTNTAMEDRNDTPAEHDLGAVWEDVLGDLSEYRPTLPEEPMPLVEEVSI